MIVKLSYQKSDSIGVFAKLTNSFCIVSYDSPLSFYKTIKFELYPRIPIISTFISGSKCVGRFLVGNKRGLLVPDSIDSQEFKNLKNFLPDDVLIKKCDEKFSTLGNSVSTNDYVALVNPEISSQTTELISDVLGVEVFKLSLGKKNLIGSYCIFNNNGGLIHPDMNQEEQDEISSLLEIPLLTGTVNHGNKLIGAGMLTNDFVTFCGTRTTQSELFIIETALKRK